MSAPRFRGSRVWRRCQRFSDLQYTGALYPLINRGNYRCGVCEAVGAAQAFVAALVETCDRQGWRIHAAPYRWVANALKVDRPASMRAQVHRRSLHVSLTPLANAEACGGFLCSVEGCPRDRSIQATPGPFKPPLRKGHLTAYQSNNQHNTKVSFDTKPK